MTENKTHLNILKKKKFKISIYFVECEITHKVNNKAYNE